jgi:hypothetical protein
VICEGSADAAIGSSICDPTNKADARIKTPAIAVVVRVFVRFLRFVMFIPLAFI